MANKDTFPELLIELALFFIPRFETKEWAVCEGEEGFTALYPMEYECIQDHDVIENKTGTLTLSYFTWFWKQWNAKVVYDE